jgi:excisionase family DNA binding protein
LFVRLPASEAEKLDRAAFELKTSKRELVAGLVARYGDLENLRALREDAIVGRAAFRNDEGREVLTAEQLADFLQLDVKTVRGLAARGDVPGKRIGRHWRFSRAAVLEWLATPERRRHAAGFES